MYVWPFNYLIHKSDLLDNIKFEPLKHPLQQSLTKQRIRQTKINKYREVIHLIFIDILKERSSTLHISKSILPK